MLDHLHCVEHSKKKKKNLALPLLNYAYDIKGSELFWDCFSVFFLVGSVFLHVFLDSCSILELETAISTVFVTFWS